MSETMTELKALVGKKMRGNEPPTLYVSTDNDSRVWATNKYWLVNAERMRPLFNHYELPIETGRYEMNGRVVSVAGDAPNVDRLMPSLDWRVISRRQVDGRDAYVRGSDDFNPYMAVLDNDGAPIFVNARYLAFVIGDERDVMFRQPKPTMPVAVYAVTRHASDEIADEEVLLGLVMPIRA